MSRNLSEINDKLIAAFVRAVHQWQNEHLEEMDFQPLISAAIENATDEELLEALRTREIYMDD